MHFSTLPSPELQWALGLAVVNTAAFLATNRVRFSRTVSQDATAASRCWAATDGDTIAGLGDLACVEQVCFWRVYN